jgi:hypothetical protein
VLRQVSAMPTNRFHGLGLWPSIPVLLARVPHQTADCFYRPGTALRGMTAGKGGEELYKQKQALNVSYAQDSYHSSLTRTSKKAVTSAVILILLSHVGVLAFFYTKVFSSIFIF